MALKVNNKKDNEEYAGTHGTARDYGTTLQTANVPARAVSNTSTNDAMPYKGYQNGTGTGLSSSKRPGGSGVQSNGSYDLTAKKPRQDTTDDGRLPGTGLNSGAETASKYALTPVDPGNGNGGNAGAYASAGNYSGTYGYSTFQPSQNVLDALNLTNSLLDKVNSGKTSYSDKVAEMIGQIEGRDKFTYDPNTDTLFQNALASAIRNGQSAMQDTIGQASALTGGYGSTYATSAANQAYNQYLQGAYDNLPDYYNTAFNTYNQETQDMYNKLGMFNDADATEYNRIYNAYAANADRYNTLYNQEYSAFRDTESDKQWAAQMEQTDRWNQADLNYKYSSLAQDQSQYDSNMAYQKQNDLESKFAYIDSVAGDDEELKQRMLAAYGLI